MNKISALALLTLCQPASAYVSSEGHEYRSACTDEAVVLQSVAPITRIIENGSNTKHLKGIEKIVLSADCLAHTSVFGYGRWEWANGGFRITFPTHEMRFPRQELYCAAGEPDPISNGPCGMF